MLSKQSQKTYRIATGKNKQEDKRLELQNKINEKNANFEDNKWVRDFVRVKQSLAEIRFSCDYNRIDQLNRYKSLSSAQESNRFSAKKLSSALPVRSHLGSKSAPSKSFSAGVSENCSIKSSNYPNRTLSRKTDITNKYFLFPGISY